MKLFYYECILHGLPEMLPKDIYYVANIEYNSSCRDKSGKVRKHPHPDTCYVCSLIPILVNIICARSRN